MSQKSIITPVFRVSYPNVFRPKLNQLSKKEEYSLVALFKVGEDLSKLKAAAHAAIVAKWGEDQKKWPRKNGVNAIRSPFRDQAEREKELEDGRKQMPDGYVKGAFFLTLKCYRQPGIVDQKREPIIDETQFYAGCWARAELAAFAYETAGNYGVSFWLNNLQKAKDDEPFSGRRKAEDAFEAIEMPSGDSSNGAAGATTDDIFG